MKVTVCRILTIILRVIQLILGTVAISLLVTLSDYPMYGKALTMLIDSRVISYLTCASTFLTADFLLLIATIHRDSYEHMRKSIFEMLYNISGALLLGTNSIIMMAVNQSVAGSFGDLLIAPGITSVVNAALYFATFFIAMKARQAT